LAVETEEPVEVAPRVADHFAPTTTGFFGTGVVTGVGICELTKPAVDAGNVAGKNMGAFPKSDLGPLGGCLPGIG